MFNIDKLKCDVYSKLITSDYSKKIHKKFTKICYQFLTISLKPNYMMDTLPLELKKKIVGHLDKSEMLKLSAVSKRWNMMLEDLIWNNPKFTTKVSLSELVQYNRPIKILNSRSLSDFDKGLSAAGATFLSSIRTLRRFVLRRVVKAAMISLSR